MTRIVRSDEVTGVVVVEASSVKDAWKFMDRYAWEPGFQRIQVNYLEGGQYLFAALPIPLSGGCGWICMPRGCTRRRNTDAKSLNV